MPTGHMGEVHRPEKHSEGEVGSQALCRGKRRSGKDVWDVPHSHAKLSAGVKPELYLSSGPRGLMSSQSTGESSHQPSAGLLASSGGSWWL